MFASRKLFFRSFFENYNLVRKREQYILLNIVFTSTIQHAPFFIVFDILLLFHFGLFCVFASSVIPKCLRYSKHSHKTFKMRFICFIVSSTFLVRTHLRTHCQLNQAQKKKKKKNWRKKNYYYKHKLLNIWTCIFVCVQ